MSNTEQNQLIADVARDIVKQIAPQEIPLFRATSAAYFQNPDSIFKHSKKKDQVLGFGAGEVIIMMTPSVLAALTQVVQFLTVEVQKSVATESASVISHCVKKMFKVFHLTEEQKNTHDALPLTVKQLHHVRQLAYEEAYRLTKSDEKAHLLANAIVGSLAIQTSSKE